MGEDVAQEALSALVARWRRFGPPESPEAFVFAVARRRAVRMVTRRALMMPLDLLRGSRAARTGVDAFERRNELRIVIGAIRRLRPADREVLLLRAAGELSLEEIAAVTHASAAAVKMRIHRARQRLGELLKE